MTPIEILQRPVIIQEGEKLIVIKTDPKVTTSVTRFYSTRKGAELISDCSRLEDLQEEGGGMLKPGYYLIDDLLIRVYSEKENEKKKITP